MFCWRFIICFAVMCVAAISSNVAGNDAGLRNGLEKTKFFTYNIAGTYNQFVMESAWERNLSADSKFANFAEEDNHNVFVIDNVVYVYVDGYKKDDVLYRFSAETGEYLGDDIVIPTYSDGAKHKDISSYTYTITSDSAGHIVIVAVRAMYGYITDGDQFIAIVRCFNDLRCTDYTEYKYTQTGKKYQYGYTDRFINNYEIGNLSGNAASGDFSFSIYGWWGSANNTGYPTIYYPAKLTLNFSTTGNCEIHRDVYVADSNEESLSNVAYSAAVNGTHIDRILNVTAVDDNTHIIQRFQTSAPCLFKFDHEEVLAGANSSVRYFKQVSRLDDDRLIGSGDPANSYGAYPLTFENVTMLLTPQAYYCSGSSVVANPLGNRWKLTRMPDSSTFEEIVPVWTFPEDDFFATPAKAFDMARPRVWIGKEDYTLALRNDELLPSKRAEAHELSHAMIYTYLPSSGLSAYRLTHNRLSVPASVNAPDDEVEADWKIALNSGRMYLEGCASGERKMFSIYSIEGRKICSISSERLTTADGADVSYLPNGLYLLVSDGFCGKFVIR